MNFLRKNIILIVILLCAISGVLNESFWRSPSRIKTLAADILKDIARSKSDRVRLDYKIYYLSFLPFGRLIYATEFSDQSTRVSLSAITKDSIVESFLDASAQITSTRDLLTGLSNTYKEKTVFKKSLKEKEILFDRTASVATRDGDVKIKIDSDIDDPVSAFVGLLRAPYRDGATERARCLAKDEIYEMTANLRAKQDGLLDILIDIHRENKTSSHGARVNVFVTDDELRIPVFFKSWTPAGYLCAVLDSAYLVKED